MGWVRMGVVAVLTGEVRAEGVGKTIDETTLLLPTDVSADPGECIVLRGPNGSGKTTLLRIIGGLLVPSTGTATIGGAHRPVALVDHLVLIDSTWGGEPATSDDRGLALLDRLGIAHLDDRFPHELSSGQEQLFRLALTFSRPASVVLLDEPEQRLDTAKRQVVAELIRERTASGATVVMACHDPELTASLASRVVDIVPAR